MEIITLLGAIIDRIAFTNDLSWNYNKDSAICIRLNATPEINNYAESLLENGDYVVTENNNTVSVIFENKRISKVCFDSEEHDVKSCIERYVNEWGLYFLYAMMSEHILSSLSE